MDQFFEFIGNHLLLAGTFVALLTMFFINEQRRGGSKVSASELVQLMNRDDAVVVDIRDRKDYGEGHITDSLNIPYSALESRMSELDTYREKTIILACKMGQASGAAGRMLMKAGFADVRRLQGGVMEWRNANMPLVKN